MGRSRGGGGGGGGGARGGGSGQVELVADRRALQLDLVVVRAVGRQQRARVLEVLALGLALHRLVERVVEPVRDEDAPVGRRQRLARDERRYTLVRRRPPP